MLPERVTGESPVGQAAALYKAMTDFSKIRLFRLTHTDNMSHVLQYGITHADSANTNPNFVPIGDGSLISTRNNFILSNGRRLGEYIPFYFAAKTPMLYVIQKGFNDVKMVAAENLVYCVSNVQKMIDSGLEFVFTDGHASNKFSAQYTREQVGQLHELIDWEAIKAKYWNSETDLDLKRRKEAEFLVFGDIPLNYIAGFVVYSERAKQRLTEMGATLPIAVRPDHYF